VSFNAVDQYHVSVHLHLPQWHHSKAEGIPREFKSYQSVRNFHTFNATQKQALNSSKSTLRAYPTKQKRPWNKRKQLGHWAKCCP
jgi:hypothetical protein